MHVPALRWEKFHHVLPRRPAAQWIQSQETEAAIPQMSCGVSARAVKAQPPCNAAKNRHKWSQSQLTLSCKRCRIYIMKRTQIQIPDQLYALARDVAAQKEISMAELVRRGLEYMIAVTHGAAKEQQEWELPHAHALNSDDPFAEPYWRERLHTERLRVAETTETCSPKKEDT
jgi:hypothetical protein